MDDLPLSYLFLFVAFVLIAAYFSICETAFLNVNKIRLKNYVDEKRFGSKKASWMSEHADQTMITIVVAKLMANLVLTLLIVDVCLRLFQTKNALFISAIVAMVTLLLFIETLPKLYAKEKADLAVLNVSPLLYGIVRLCSPITSLFLLFKQMIFRSSNTHEHVPSVTEEELKVMIDLSEEEGLIDQREKELVQSALDFNDIIIAEILKPRIDVIAVEVNQPLDEIKEVFLSERFSRIPVYEGDIDNIIGILSERDFLSALVRYGHVDIRKILMKPMFVVGTQQISVVLRELQKNKMHMAIVIDEFGGTAGIVTMEDILEELVGDIWDEHDEKIKIMTQLDDHNYLFYADFPVDDFCKITQVQLPEGSYHTLGGWIVEELEHLPKPGEQLTYQNLKFTIVEVEKRRIRKVKVTMMDELTAPILEKEKSCS